MPAAPRRSRAATTSGTRRARRPSTDPRAERKRVVVAQTSSPSWISLAASTWKSKRERKWTRVALRMRSWVLWGVTSEKHSTALSAWARVPLRRCSETVSFSVVASEVMDSSAFVKTSIRALDTSPMISSSVMKGPMIFKKDTPACSSCSEEVSRTICKTACSSWTCAVSISRQSVACDISVKKKRAEMETCCKYSYRSDGEDAFGDEDGDTDTSASSASSNFFSEGLDGRTVEDASAQACTRPAQRDTTSGPSDPSLPPMTASTRTSRCCSGCCCLSPEPWWEDARPRDPRRRRDDTIRSRAFSWSMTGLRVSFSEKKEDRMDSEERCPPASMTAQGSTLEAVSMAPKALMTPPCATATSACIAPHLAKSCILVPLSTNPQSNRYSGV
mmetsp:Transcript_25023/g.57836  ORF Transcript_25023/g.57836 Transcript_25023/m.57836 type:complete len:389 (+) Transcript_25023:425-1591(+)